LLIFTTYDRPHPEPTALHPYLEERLFLLSKDLPPEVRIETAFAAGEMTVRLDPVRMETVLAAIIDNAREALADGGGRIRIATERIAAAGPAPDRKPAENAGPMARIAVSDNGVGMDAATRERVFDPFFSTKFLGRGMSMAAAQGIVRGHGGILSIDSAPGRGTVVHIDLPLSTPC
jgi:signal transduction histidine kinase